MKSVEIFDIKINPLSKSEFKNVVKRALHSQKLLRIAKLNSEFLVRSQASKEFHDLLNQFELKIADGVGVCWASRFLNYKSRSSFINFFQLVFSLSTLIIYPKYTKKYIPETIPGVEAMNIMLGAAVESDSGIYILGAEEKILKKAIEVIKFNHPKIKIVGSNQGYGFDTKKVIEDINELQAEMLFVALGSPDQEKWIVENCNKIQSLKVAVGEGGSLDFIAGDFKRAPKWMRAVSLEWLFRLFTNRSKTKKTGSRLKRVLTGVLVLILKTYQYKLKLNHEKDRNSL